MVGGDGAVSPLCEQLIPVCPPLAYVKQRKGLKVKVKKK
jgi:hypothetical protein